MSEPGQGRSWWTTLPGVLTGVAALLTAVTGLVVALLPLIATQRDAASPGAKPRATESSTSSPSPTEGADRKDGTSRRPMEQSRASAGSVGVTEANQPSGAAPLVYGETLDVAGTRFEVLKVDSGSPRPGVREIHVTFQVTAGPTNLWLARSNVRLVASGRVHTPIEGLPATALRTGAKRQFWVRFEIEEPLTNPVLSFTDDMSAPRGEVRRGLNGFL